MKGHNSPTYKWLEDKFGGTKERKNRGGDNQELKREFFQLDTDDSSSILSLFHLLM